MISSLQLTLLAALLAAVPAVAQSTGSRDTTPAPAAPAKVPGQLLRLTEGDADWAAEARKQYPLTVCVVSQEALGSMGVAPEYRYRVDGQPDRLVKFCCAGCEESFLEDPAAHLARIDEARRTGAPAANAGSHSSH